MRPGPVDDRNRAAFRQRPLGQMAGQPVEVEAAGHHARLATGGIGKAQRDRQGLDPQRARFDQLANHQLVARQGSLEGGNAR